MISFKDIKLPDEQNNQILFTIMNIINIFGKIKGNREDLRIRQNQGVVPDTAALPASFHPVKMIPIRAALPVP
jgi:hypothetical protein